MNKLLVLVLLLCGLGVLAGCDPVTRHKVTSTIFDGVPTLPPAEQFCQEYHEKKSAEEKAGAVNKQTANAASVGSKHLPYDEKKCNNCHDKTQESGLIKPKNQLCFVCHPKIVAKRMQHGPAAVGSCLECHDPHTSNYPFLLKAPPKEVCATCHAERRLAFEMHNKVTRTGMLCADCHDPHAGDAQYFLR